MKKRIHISRGFDHLRFLGMLVAAVLIFSSCQKVIKLDLNTANPQVVIIGYVTDQPGVDTVKITMTGSFFNPGNYPAVTNATVIISDNTGIVDTLVQTSNGVYAAPNLTGVPGRTYTMKALINGKEYDAMSAMPTPVNIDSISIYNTSTIDTINGVVDTINHVRCYFRDPGAQRNYYRVVGIINGLVLDSADDFNLLSNEFDAGTEMNRRLRNCNPFQGQNVIVQLETIDAGTYNYYNVLNSIASEGNPVSTAVPQNPPTNIMGGALGYFAAYPLRTASGVTP